MKRTIFLKRTMLLVVMILTALYANAAYYGGTITIKVGDTYSVSADFGGGLVQTGSWSKSNSTFIFVSRGNKSCTIQGNQVGTGTLYYTGYAGAYDADTYWTVNVVSSTPNSSLTITATPAGGTVERGTKVRLIASNESAIIVYTLDGSDPVTSSTKQAIPSDYSNGPVINESCTLKAYAEYINRSDVYTWTYTVNKVEGIEINATNFPDANFRNYLLEQDYGKDGVLTETEIKGIISIDVSNKNISSLKGIEYFTELTRIVCDENQINILDLSKNTKLVQLWCNDNQLTSLDISKQTELQYLKCNRNQLTSLDISNNTALIELECGDNLLTSLDASKNVKLTKLYCHFNKLAKLIVSNKGSLNYLTCWKNMLNGSAMNEFINSLPNNTTNEMYPLAIYYGYSDGNICTKKDVTTAINKGWLPKGFATIGNYEGVDEEDATIRVMIDEEHFPDSNFRNYLLTQRYGMNGFLTTGDIKQINVLAVTSKNISSLKGIEYLTALQKLFCSGNQLYSLDVSKNTILEQLICSSNQLTTLNVSNCEKLTDLDCSKNQLTTLNVSNCMALNSFSCYLNMIQGEAMDEFINSLPNMKENILKIYNDIEGDEKNRLTKSQVILIKEKGWIPVYCSYVHGGESGWKLYEGSDDGPVSITLPEVETVSVNGTIKLVPTIEPADAVTEITWKSNDTSIAMVNSTGTVIGIKEGATIVSATTSNGLIAECFIVVTSPDGIDDVQTDNDSNAPVYNLSGQQVKHWKGKKGIYIVNGKKIVVK